LKVPPLLVPRGTLILKRSSRLLKTPLRVEQLCENELLAAVGPGAQLLDLILQSLRAGAPMLKRLFLRRHGFRRRGLAAALLRLEHGERFPGELRARAGRRRRGRRRIDRGTPKARPETLDFAA
jgi:hypothetical protein